jgi:Domain of unknown function (DUF1744)
MRAHCGAHARCAAQVAYVRDSHAARTHLASDLAAFRAAHRGPMCALLVAASPAAAAALRRGVPALRALPVCVAAVPAAAAAAAFDSALGAAWQEAAPRAALELAAVAPAWLQERAALARYAGVPLCNLPDAAHHAAMDAAFARALHDANHLLWAEDRSLPDVVPAAQRVEEAPVPAPDPVSIDNRCVAIPRCGSGSNPAASNAALRAGARSAATACSSSRSSCCSARCSRRTTLPRRRAALQCTRTAAALSPPCAACSQGGPPTRRHGAPLCTKRRACSLRAAAA